MINTRSIRAWDAFYEKLDKWSHDVSFLRLICLVVGKLGGTQRSANVVFSFVSCLGFIVSGADAALRYSAGAQHVLNAHADPVVGGCEAE